MKKIMVVSVAVLAVSTSAAFAKHHKMMKPKPAAATMSSGPMMMGQTSAADMAMYKKNQHDSGMKK